MLIWEMAAMALDPFDGPQIDYDCLIVEFARSCEPLCDPLPKFIMDWSMLKQRWYCSSEHHSYCWLSNSVKIVTAGLPQHQVECTNVLVLMFYDYYSADKNVLILWFLYVNVRKPLLELLFLALIHRNQTNIWIALEMLSLHASRQHSLGWESSTAWEHETISPKLMLHKILHIVSPFHLFGCRFYPGILLSALKYSSFFFNVTTGWTNLTGWTCYKQ